MVALGRFSTYFSKCSKGTVSSPMLWKRTTSGKSEFRETKSSAKVKSSNCQSSSIPQNGAATEMSFANDLPISSSDKNFNKADPPMECPTKTAPSSKEAISSFNLFFQFSYFGSSGFGMAGARTS